MPNSPTIIMFVEHKNYSLPRFWPVDIIVFVVYLETAVLKYAYQKDIEKVTINSIVCVNT